MNFNIKLSIALVISVLSLVVLTCGTWLGLTITGFDRIGALIAAGAVFLIGLLSLLFGLQSKNSRGDHKNWKTTQLLSIVGMCLAAAFAFMPMVYSFNYVKNSKELSGALEQDTNQLTAIVNDFHNQQHERINNYELQMRPYIGNSAYTSGALQEHIESNFDLGGEHFGEGFLDARLEEMRLACDSIAVLNDNGNLVSRRYDVGRVQSYLNGNVARMDPTQIPALRDKLGLRFAEIEQWINSSAAIYEIPIVEWDGSNGVYTVVENPAPTFSIGETHFAAALERQKNISLAGVLFTLLVVALYLLDFLLTPVTGKLPPVDPKPSDRHGKIL